MGSEGSDLSRRLHRQGQNLESVPEARSDGCRVGATHQRKALAFGGLHPPYEGASDPFGPEPTLSQTRAPLIPT